MNTKIIIESLSMDLLRVALGLHRGSFKMADRFKQESLRRINELRSRDLDEHTKSLVRKTSQALNQNSTDVAEDLLMYSTLFKNLSQKIKL